MRTQSMKKVYAAMMVAIMMVVPMTAVDVSLLDAGITLPSSVADEESLPDYAYKLRITGNDSSVSVEGVYEWNSKFGMWSTEKLKNLKESGTIWKYDTTTGYGPFNSFYAAIDVNGNIAAVLNPNDLSKSVVTTDSTNYLNGSYNIMWVIPTVYISSENDGSLVLASTPNFGGTAYAHTIDGHSYDYLSIGVYEASLSGSGSTAKLMSVSGQYPTVLQSRATFSTQAGNTYQSGGESMLWNWYQWNLYRYCSCMVMGSFDSQSTVGLGVIIDTPHKTGETNNSGFYTGTSSDKTKSSKLFLENSWGNMYEFVGDAVFDGQSGLYVGQSSAPTDETTKASVYITAVLPSSGYVEQIYTSERIWGLGKTTGGTSTTGLCDDLNTQSSADRVLIVGGKSWSGYRDGVNTIDAYESLSFGSAYLGSRLAYVFDADRSSSTSDSYTYQLITKTANGETSVYAVYRDGKSVQASTGIADMNSRWGFDSNGFGPFNSFYAEMTDDGRILAILNPSDLTVRIDGNDVVSTHNIMWILPTVYWKTSEYSYGSGDDTVTFAVLTLSNDSSKGTAYAHTIGGHVYQYLALGVYEATAVGDKLMSLSGKTPTANQSRYVFHNQADNTYASSSVGSSSLWNYYQWTLYRMCSYTVMGSFDSQSIVGQGITSGSGHGTGETDMSGSYAGSSSTNVASKLFIENSWGNYWEFVDDCYVNNYVLRAGQNDLGQLADDNAYMSETMADICTLPKTHTSNCSANTVHTGSVSWGMAKTVVSTSSYSVGLCDAFWTSAGSNRLYVGGWWVDGQKCGVGDVRATGGLSDSSSAEGARLAYVFDSGPVSTSGFDSGSSYVYTLTTSEIDGAVAITGVTKNGMPVTGIAGTSDMDSKWGFDANGIGPFNSFYAEMTEDGRIAAVLNPNDLTKHIDGTATDMNRNIMWILPTVYWKTETVDGITVLTLSNDSSKGTAYAHTIGGHVYQYLALGVYEATVVGDKLMSLSGQKPTVSQSRYVFHNQADNTYASSSVGLSSLWNYYQWTLYKMCSYTVMGSFDSQSIVGTGNTGGGLSHKTGETDTSGSYAGECANPTKASKLFIENSWGNYWEFVDDCYMSGYVFKAGQNDLGQMNSDDDYKSKTMANICTLPFSYGWNVKTVNTDSVSWGMAKTTKESRDFTVGLCDGLWTTSGDKALMTGVSGLGYGGEAGLASTKVNNDLSYSYVDVGARLAYVFDSDPAAITGTQTADPDWEWRITDTHLQVQSKKTAVNTFPSMTSRATPWYLYSRNVTSVEDCTVSGGGPVTSVVDGAFDGIKLTSIDMKDVTSLYGHVFEGNASLSSVDLPSLSAIADSEFEGCTGLKHAVLSSAASVGTYAFSGCSSLLTVDVSHVASVGTYAFSGCSSVKVIDLPSVTSLGDFAFSGCSSLEYLFLDSLTEITEGMFSGASIVNVAGTFDDRYAYKLTIKDNDTSVKVDDVLSYDFRTGAWTSKKGLSNWSFDDDGVGPFNSFYAAIDSDGSVATVLDPNNLSRSVDTADTTDYLNGKYNIMWVIPTVYISTDADGSLTLSNTKDFGGTAYAHTVDGQLYNYLSIGVYEASVSGTGADSKLMSVSGAKPITSEKRSTVSAQAGNTYTTGGESMLWNWYQWNLYRYCSYMVMGSFDSQSVVGQGVTGDSQNHDTGETNTSGFYAGSSDAKTASKLFIENSWGNLWEFVGDVVVNGQSGLYIGQSSDPTDESTKASDYIVASLPHGNIATIYTSERIWGLAKTSGVGGLYDTMTSASSDDHILCVGGYWAFGSAAGVGNQTVDYYATAYNVYTGGRLAYVYSAADTTTVGFTLCVPNVTHIGDSAFSNFTMLETVELPKLKDVGDSVSAVGNSAFEGCTALNTVKLPSIAGISLGDDAFKSAGCTEGLVLKSNIKKIGTGAFSYASIKSINSVESGSIVMNGITNVPENAFKGTTVANTFSSTSAKSVGTHGFSDSAFTDIDLTSVTSLGQYAFSGCTSLKTLNLSDAVQSVGQYAFKDCGSGKSFVITGSMYNIGQYAFMDSNVSGINPTDDWRIVLTGTVSIGKGAFSGSAVTSVRMPSLINSMSDAAFEKCDSLTKVSMPEYTGGIPNKAFFDCDVLSIISAPKASSVGAEAFKSCSQLATVELSDDCTSVGESAFEGCSSFDAKDIIGGITTINVKAFKGTGTTQLVSTLGQSIGNYAFSGCMGLSKVDSKAVSAGVGAFEDCTAILTVKLDSLTSLGENAFKGCSSLSSISAAELMSVPAYSFQNCNALNEVAMGKLTTVGDYAFDSSGITKFNSVESKAVLGNNMSIGQYAFRNILSASLVIGDNVSIGQYAFTGCTMTNITAGDISTISKGAFENCADLQSVTVGDVISIETDAFRNCNSMKTLTAGDVTTVAGGAFSGCTELNAVNAGKVTSLSEGAFRDCTGLKTVSVTYTKNIGAEAFKGCSSLSMFTDHTKTDASDPNMSYMTLTESIGTDAFYGTAIKSLSTSSIMSLSSGAFEGMASLEEAVIQVDADGPDTLPDRAFSGCTSLKTVHLSSEIERIGSDAFPSQSLTVYWCSKEPVPAFPSNVTVISSGTVGVTYAKVTVKGGETVQIRRIIQGSKFVLPYGESGDSIDFVQVLKDSDGNRKELTAGRSGDVLAAYTQNNGDMTFEAHKDGTVNGFTVTAFYGGEGNPLSGKTTEWTVTAYGQTIELPVPNKVEGAEFRNYEGTVSGKSFSDGTNPTIQNPIPVVMTFFEEKFELLSDSSEYTVRFSYNSQYETGKEDVYRTYTRGDPIATPTNPLPDTVELEGYICIGWCYNMDPDRPVQDSDTVTKNMTVYLMFEQNEVTVTIKSSFNNDVLATITSKQYVDLTVYNRGDANGGKIFVTGLDVRYDGEYYTKDMGNLFDTSYYGNQFGYDFRYVIVGMTGYGDSDDEGYESTGRMYSQDITVTVKFELRLYSIVFESYMLGTSSLVEDGPDKGTIKIDGQTYAGGVYRSGMNHTQIVSGIDFPIQKISVQSYSFSKLDLYSGMSKQATYDPSKVQSVHIDDTVFGNNSTVTLKLYFETGKYVIRYDTTACSGTLVISNSPALSSEQDVSKYNYAIMDGSQGTLGYTFKGWKYRDISGNEHDVTADLAGNQNRFTADMMAYGDRHDMFVDFYATWEVNKYAVKYVVTDEYGFTKYGGLSESVVSKGETFPTSFTYEEGGVTKTMDLSQVKMDYYALSGWEYTPGKMIEKPGQSPLTADMITYATGDRPVVGGVQTKGTVVLTTVWTNMEYTLNFDTGSTSIPYKYDSQTKEIGDVFVMPDAQEVRSMYPLHRLSDEPCWTLSHEGLEVKKFQSGEAYTLDETILQYQTDGKLKFTVFWIYDSYYITYSMGSEAATTSGVLPETSVNTYQIGSMFPVSPTTYEEGGKQVPYLKRVGYTLAGWYYIDGAAITLPSSTQLTEDMARTASNGYVYLYPVWVPLIYKIDYNWKDGESSGAFAPEQVEFGTEFEISVPSKFGYKFIGWTADITTLNTDYSKYRSGSAFVTWTGTLTKATNFINLTDSTTVAVSMTANWIESEYAIVYNGNNGNTGSGEPDLTDATKKATINGEIILADKGTLKKPGYSFAGWSLDGVTPIKTDGQRKTVFTESMSNYADDRLQVTMYAVWTVNSYEIQYSTYDGATSKSVRTYYDKAEAVGLPERDGYVFVGWSLDRISGGSFSDYASYSLDGTAWSNWPSDSGFVAYGMYVKNLTDDPNAVVILKGVWSLNDYTLVYNANGGKGTVPAESGGWKLGDPMVLPDPTGLSKDGYQFSGWSLDKENRINKTVFDIGMVETADRNDKIVLYALWTVGRYTVLSTEAEESPEVSVVVSYGISFKLGVTERVGYTFEGWSSDDISVSTAMYSRDGESWFSWTDTSEPVDALYFKNLTPVIDETVHLAGQWTETEYTVQYSANGGKGEVPLDENVYCLGDEFKVVDVKDAKITKTNCTLVGWALEADSLYTDDLTEMDEEMISYANKANVIMLYAVWAAGSYTVSVDIGDSVPSSIPVGWNMVSKGVYTKEAHYGDSVKDYTDEWSGVQLQLDGQKFVGWSTNQSTVVSDVVIKAAFEPVNSVYLYITVGIIIAIIVVCIIITRIERR